MKGYTICGLHHIVHYIISLKYPYLNTWRSKWVLQPTTKPKVDIKLCFLRRSKQCLGVLQFPALTHLSHPPFETSVYLIHFV